MLVEKTMLVENGESRPKFLFTFKLNFNGGQFYRKTLNFDYFKKLSKLH